MSDRQIVVVILAAGKGTRLRSDLAKVLHRAGGRPLVAQVISACQPIGASDIFVVVGHQAEKVSEVAAQFDAKPILQDPQNGTGHAMQVSREPIGAETKYAVVVPGDAPLIRTETLAALIETHLSGHAAATVLTAEVTNPAGYGRIVRKPDGSVAAIVEDKAANTQERGIREINSGAYCFTLEKLWPCLEKLRPENAHKELYLTDAIGLLNQHGEKVLAHLAGDAFEVLGCNTRAELAEADRLFRRNKAVALMDAGVTIYLPETVLIDPDVEVGQDTVIEPCVQLLGTTKVGTHCTVKTGAVLLNTVLADHAVVEAHSYLEGASLGESASVGPFARLRTGADIRKNARIGNFVEVKNSIVHEGAKAQHLTYLGDAIVGRSTNIGAGTITCNYDGVHKNKTIIGERVFIGSDTALVAPVEIGDGAYVAAGSTITENVPADALGIARSRQANKLGWAAARRSQQEASKKSESSEHAHSSPTRASNGSPGDKSPSFSATRDRRSKSSTEFKRRKPAPR